MLDTLPEEILLSIFANLVERPTQLHKNPHKALRPIKQKWSTLASLCRTCKRFRNITEPLLYRNYAKPDTVYSPSMQRQFRCFLRTILKRPDLAQCVRALHIGAWPHPGSRENLYHDYRDPEDTSEEWKVGPPSDDLVALYIANTHLTNVQDHHRESWVYSLEHGDEEAEITLLLAVTLNIEHLEWAMPTSAVTFMGQVAGKAYLYPQLLAQPAIAHPFKDLKSLSVYRNDLEYTNESQTDPYSVDGEGGFFIAPFLPFLNLPKLEQFIAQGACQTHNYLNEEYPACEPQSSKLKYLTLRLCGLAPKVLEHLTTRCSGLLHFECSFAEDVFDTLPFSWDTVGRIIQSQKHSLRSLVLDSENMSQLSFELEQEGSLVPIGSLQDFSALTYLSARQVALLGFEDVSDDDFTPARPILPLARVLPPNLENLIIENCTMFAVPQLENVLANLLGLFSKLQSVGAEPVDLHLGEPDLSPEQSKERLNRLVQLRAGFRSAGVQWVETSHLAEI